MDHEDFLPNLNDNLINKPLEEVKNERFSSDVASGKVKFLTVVESLQGVLTNENISIREKGIEFLSWLLSKLPKELFNSSEISVLVNFYCDCLKGHHNFISPAIKGLLELIQMKPLNKENLVKILVTLFQNVNCQSQLHPDRIILYKILKFVLENFLEDLKEMGPDFVFGVISIIEGESDPFCLIIIFNCLPIFIKKFDLGHLSEEMFEVLSCYFPLDFNPSSKEPTVTREELSEALHNCLSASDSFSEQSIGLILEKADSTLKTAKLDCYKLLQECCKTISVDNLEKHINTIWKTLSKDVLPGTEKQICENGLSALADIFHLLSQNELHLNILNTFIDDILITIRSSTNRIDENMFQPAIRILIAASSKSEAASRRILHNLKSLPQLKSNSTPMETKIFLSSFLPFLKIFQKYKIMESQNPEEVLCYFDLVNLYLNAGASADCEIRKLAFLGILNVLSNSSDEFRRKLFEIILENITNKDDIKSSQEFINVWKSLAENYPLEIHDFVTKCLSINETDRHFPNVLLALSVIADHPKFTSYVIKTLITVIDGKRKYNVALKSLLNACKFAKTNDKTDFFHLIHSEQNVINRLMLWYLEFNPREELRQGITKHLVSEIIALVTRNQNSASQQAIVDNITQMFFGEVSQLNGDYDAPIVQRTNDFPPDFVLILEAVLGSVRQEVKIPMVWTLREKLSNLAFYSEDESVRLSSSRLLASFVNKTEESFDLLNVISKDIFTHLEDNHELRVRLNSSVLFTWIVKGVILRDGASSENWISTWFSLLAKKDVGEEIAEGFRTVIEEDDLYLNLESHCNVRILYRQRLFGYHSKLVEMHETSDPSVKMNYMLALVRLLQGVPIHLIKMEISNIITILVRCLDADKPEVLLTSLEILTLLLNTKEGILTDYIQSFVPKFLKLARFENHMKIRINALKCLYFYGFYPTINVLPFKNQVIQELEGCLDDKKRLARKEAVRARCRWFLVGAPGEDILVS